MYVSVHPAALGLLVKAEYTELPEGFAQHRAWGPSPAILTQKYSGKPTEVNFYQADTTSPGLHPEEGQQTALQPAHELNTEV